MIKKRLAYVAFEAIESDLQRFLEYIPAETHQFTVYSFKLSDIIIRSCSQLDSLFKEIIKNCDLSAHPDQTLVSDCKMKVKNNKIKIIDYLKLFSDFYELVSIEVDSIDRVSFQCKPFKNLKSDLKNGKPPKWWTAYNKLKHDYYGNAKLGNLGNALDSLSALFALNCKVKEAWESLVLSEIIISPNFKDLTTLLYFMKKHPDLDKYNFIARSKLFEYWLRYENETLGTTVMGTIQTGIH